MLDNFVKEEEGKERREKKKEKKINRVCVGGNCHAPPLPSRSLAWGDDDVWRQSGLDRVKTSSSLRQTGVRTEIENILTMSDRCTW